MTSLGKATQNKKTRVRRSTQNNPQPHRKIEKNTKKSKQMEQNPRVSRRPPFRSFTMQNARVPDKSSTFPSPVSSLPSLSSFSPVPMTPGIEYTLSRAPLANPITSMPFRVRADSAALLRRQSFQSPSCHTSNNPPRFPSTGPRGERKRIRRKAQLQEVQHPRNCSTDLATISSSCHPTYSSIPSHAASRPTRPRPLRKQSFNRLSSLFFLLKI